MRLILVNAVRLPATYPVSGCVSTLPRVYLVEDAALPLHANPALLVYYC